MALSAASNVYPYYYTFPKGLPPVCSDFVDKFGIPLEPIRDRGHCLDGAKTLHSNLDPTTVVQTPPDGTSCSGCYYVSNDPATATYIDIYFCDYDPTLNFYGGTLDGGTTYEQALCIASVTPSPPPPSPPPPSPLRVHSQGAPPSLA